MRNRAGRDLRGASVRQAWLANRARNALHRPTFIGAISVATFVTAIVSMIVVPRAQSRPAPAVAIAPRPDTIGLLADLGAAHLRVGQADSALGAARAMVLAAARQRVADSVAALRMMDSLGLAPRVTRDSLQSRLAVIDRLLARAEQAPLPASYRAIAELPDLRADPRILALADSLQEIEREREGFGAVGGVDPVFVALTTRLNEIGRAIVTVAAERRAAAATELAALAPLPTVAAPANLPDTAAVLASRDSAASAVREIHAELTRRRQRSLALDAVERRARERANAVAPPLALLGAAFVLSAVFGFGAALFGELRKPRVSTAQELERFLGIRVLSTVDTTLPSAERGRREADRAAPPYLDPTSEGYQLAYLGLATDHPALLTVTVTGDNPIITAVVACNLAAVAADEARSTLVLDLDPRASASAALRNRVAPGVSDVLQGARDWPDVTVQAPVGRDKHVDLLPRGSRPVEAEALAGLSAQHARWARYYDAIVVLASAEAILGGLPGVLPSPELVYCAQPGVTPLRELRAELERFRAAGAEIRGVVLWQAERPLLPVPRDVDESAKAAADADRHAGVPA